MMRTALLILAANSHSEFKKSKDDLESDDAIVGHMFDNFGFNLIVEKSRIILNFFCCFQSIDQIIYFFLGKAVMIEILDVKLFKLRFCWLFFVYILLNSNFFPWFRKFFLLFLIHWCIGSYYYNLKIVKNYKIMICINIIK